MENSIKTVSERKEIAGGYQEVTLRAEAIENGWLLCKTIYTSVGDGPGKYEESKKYFKNNPLEKLSLWDEFEAEEEPVYQ